MTHSSGTTLAYSKMSFKRQSSKKLVRFKHIICVIFFSFYSNPLFSKAISNSNLPLEYLHLEKLINDYDSHEMPQEYHEYKNEFQSAINSLYPTPAFPEDFNRTLSSSQIVLITDYHGIPEFQNKATEILSQMINYGQKPTLVLEWLSIEALPLVKKYLSGGISEEALMTSIEAQNFWNFPLRGYLEILKVAKKEKLQIILPESTHDSSLLLKERDQKIIDALLTDQQKHIQGKPYFILYGAYHILGKQHLSERFEALGFKTLNVVTFADPIFFKALANKFSPQLLKLNSNSFYINVLNPITRLKQELADLQKSQGPSWAQLVEDFDKLP